MKKLCNQINKYLIISIGVLALFLVTIFAVTFGANSLRLSNADEIVIPTESWLNHMEDPTKVTETTYKISRPSQFASVCYDLNYSNGATYNGKTFYITNNLDFGDYYWEPMGSSSDKPVFANFIAQNENLTSTVKLSNIIIDNSKLNSDVAEFGFFGRVDNCTSKSQGYLQGIELVNINYIIDVSKVTSDTINIGGLAGYYAGQVNSEETSDACMVNCSATGTITVTQSESTAKKVNIGGLVGQVGMINASTTPKINYTLGSNYQTNNVTINVAGVDGSTYTVGGLAGTNAGTIDCCDSRSINSAINIGEITSNIGSVGAVVGVNSATGIIKNTTSGITSQTTPLLTMNSDALSGLILGGIAGTNQGEITNCQNYAMIEGYLNSLGGIAGLNYGTISKCTNNAEIYIDEDKVPDSAKASTGNSFAESPMLGGIAGANQNGGTVSECINNASIGGVKNVSIVKGIAGGIVGRNRVNSTITNCINYGTIGEMMLATASGGIVGTTAGKITADTNKTTVSKFTVNLGKIYANENAGGIAGSWNEDTKDSQPTVIVENCYNVGEVLGQKKETDSSLGGIIGKTQNCQTDSQIINCINLGKIGATDRAKNVGGIVGSNGYTTLDITNCANYGDLYGVIIGGILGSTNTSLALNYVLATGSLNIITETQEVSAGGIIGKVGNSSGSFNFNTSIFDLGVLGYNLPASYTKSNDKFYQLKLIGSGNSQANFVKNNSPMTYYMTKPGVTETVSQNYFPVQEFYTNSAWTFLDADTTNRIYYYPIPIIFYDGGIFTKDATTVSDKSLTRQFPSQQLSKVTIANDLPVEWDATNNSEISEVFYINIYPDLVMDEVQNNTVENGQPQYIITGQMVGKPTATTTALYKSDYDTPAEFDNAVKELGLQGKYNIHQGFKEAFKLNSPTGSTYSFSDPINDSEVNIVICWMAKEISVATYEYDEDEDVYKQITDMTATITYSLDPTSMKTISLPQKEGRTYYGWRTNNDLFYKDASGNLNYDTEQDWINAWQTDSTLEFSANDWYASGLKIYCMSVKKDITVYLKAGSVDTSGFGDLVYGKFTKADGDLAIELQITIKWGEESDLPVPELESTTDYVFSGYFDSTSGGICLSRSGQNYIYNGTASSVELFAQWTKIVKTLKYLTQKENGEVKELYSVDVRYDQLIDTSAQANSDNLASWGVDYSKVDGSLDPNGFEFAGVYSDSACQFEFDFATTKIYGDTNLYIKWSVKQFSLILNANIGVGLDGKLRTGGWKDSDGDYSMIRTLTINYHENLANALKTWKLSKTEESTLEVTGFTPLMLGGISAGYNWAIKSIAMGESYKSEDLLSNNSQYQYMPASNDLVLYIVWEKQSGRLTFNANGGYFANSSGGSDGITKTYNVTFEANISQTIKDIQTEVTTPVREGWIFKYWSATQDGGAISDTAVMPLNYTLYAIYGEQRTVKFYVIGAYPENLLGQVVVFDGATLSDGISGMNEILQKMNSMLTAEDGQSAFELDYWVEMTYDMGYNVTEATEPFDFATRVINDNINLLAKLKPNENYVPPSKDTTNYIIIAGIIIIVALVLLFIVLLARPTRTEYSSGKKAKNQDIQAKLDEIRELERRRKNMDNPYD